MTKKHPKFVQVATTDNWIYALDEDGTVWEYYPNNKTWHKLSMERAK